MTTGKVKTLFTDKEKTEALFPRTKLSAVSDENGVGLDALMEHLAYTDEKSNDIIINTIDADSLSGVPAKDWAQKSFVTSEIAKAQFSGSGSGDINLDGFATKDDLNNIDFPVDSVNGKTGDVQLNAADVSARPDTWMPNASDVGAAPTGYGLGEKCVIIDNWDNATKNGYYASNGNSPDNYWWWGEVFAFGAVVIQHLVRNNDVDNSPMSFYRSIVNGNPTSWINTSYSAFAPSGFGLGAGCKWVASMDNIYENGWYECDLGSMGYFVGIVTKYSNNSCIQHMWSINTASDGSLKEIQRHIVSGVAQPWVYCSPNNFAPASHAHDYAPAGYGLGTVASYATTLTNANDGVANGWYRIDANTTNGVGYVATLRVDAYANNNLVQTAYQHNRSDYVTIKQRECLYGTWTEWKNVSPSAFAPASHTHSYAPNGYGLGDKDHAPVVGDWGTLNAMVQPGWYKVAFTTWRAGSHLLLVDAAHDLIVQTFIWQDGSGIISGQRCKTPSSDWTELEWVNPPMAPDAEYRTTERWNGKPVYTKLLVCTTASNLVGNTTVNFPHGISNIDTASARVDMTTFHSGFDSTNGAWGFPYYSMIYNQQAFYIEKISSTEIKMRIEGGSSSWDAGRTIYFLMKYTKK